MTIEEIEELITIYTGLCINYGTYSLGVTAEKEIAYGLLVEMKSKLKETIIEYVRESAAEAFNIGAHKCLRESLDDDKEHVE